MKTTDIITGMVAEVRIDFYSKVPISKMPQVKQSKTAYDILRAGWTEINYREKFKVLFLNRANRVLGVREISSGGTNGTFVDVKMILQAALGCNANSMILDHNHPSGNFDASDADRFITQKIKQAAELFDILVIDHLIMTDESFLSFSEEGLLF
jgi:DNA repair protein RadC